MKKISIALIALAVLITGAVFVVAQRGDGEGGRRLRGHGEGRHGRHMGGPGGGMMLRGLDLTDEQKAQVKQIMEASKEKAGGTREAMKANREKLQDLTSSGTFDEAQVTALANEQGGLHAQAVVERARVGSQIFAILTDEQKAKAAEMKTKMKERFNKRRGAGRQAPSETQE